MDAQRGFKDSIGMMKKYAFPLGASVLFRYVFLMERSLQGSRMPSLCDLPEVWRSASLFAPCPREQCSCCLLCSAACFLTPRASLSPFALALIAG